MTIHNRVPELLAAKYGDNINISHLAEETGMARNTVRSWVKGQVTRFETETLDFWSEFFNLPDGDSVLIYRKADSDE